MNNYQVSGFQLARGASWAQVFFVGISFLIGTHTPAGGANPQRLPAVRIEGVPVAPMPTAAAGAPLGVGLCAAYRPTASPPPDSLFPRRANYPGPGVQMFANAINDFMDGVTGGVSSGVISFATLLTPFDLASQIPGLGQQAIGDFKSTRGCEPSDAGCPYPASNMTMAPQGAFGARFRGFLAIPPGWTKQTVHFGFVTDLAVAMRFYVSPKEGQAPELFEVVSRADDGSSSQYRVTNGVYFARPGLYAVEILHANTGSPGYLEMAVLIPSSGPEYVDLDESIFVDVGGLLSGSGFIVAPPGYFFQAASGAPPFPGIPDKCQQCPRSWANQPNQGNQNICPSGLFCNEAAVCAPCTGDLFCGAGCVRCEGDTPYCIRNPKQGGSDYICAQCSDEKGCKPGQQCISGKCISPCLCCEGATFCVATDPAQPDVRNCSACAHDSDCPGGLCDLINGRCVEKLPANSKDTECGPNRSNCQVDTKPAPQDPQSLPLRPYCMNGQVCVQCRFDADCKSGNYCLSGECTPCTTDRHCGPTCNSCGVTLSISPTDGSVDRKTSDKPFCLAVDREVATASCVRCKEDSHCGPGGTCDLRTHQCQTACSGACGADEVCDGASCVECYASSQCLCGQCVDGKCSTRCGDSKDCRSNQCCATSTGQCIDGRCKPELFTHGGVPCCSAAPQALMGAAEPELAVASHRLLGALLAALGLFLLMRRAARRATCRPPG